ncbi:MAG: putative short-chain dehydrogenase/reductase family protein [Alphaproteobacteria bacterium]|nr:putative short-chain dehydrogenase/reductase family protein [Alphaproteobacteria bacterium]
MQQPSSIVITGASSGLGAALALHYAAPGVTLGLIGRNAERLEQFAGVCRKYGATVVTGLLDVADATALGQWLEEFNANHPIDLCIANAGISAGTGGGGETAEQVKRIFNINVNGVINTLHPVMTLMRARGRGQLGIVSSIAGYRGSPTAPAYSASKAAVRIYGQGLRGFLSPFGVDVSVICPGFIDTRMTKANGFPMPFIMKADRAARIVKQGLSKKKAVIAFPWPMVLMAHIQNLLPDALMDRIYRGVPAKPSA